MTKTVDLTTCGLKPVIRTHASVVEVKPIIKKEKYRIRRSKQDLVKYMVHCNRCEWVGVLLLPSVAKGEVVDMVSVECPNCHKEGMCFRRGTE